VTSFTTWGANLATTLCIEPKGAQVANSARTHAKTRDTRESADTRRSCIACSPASVVGQPLLRLGSALSLYGVDIHLDNAHLNTRHHFRSGVNYNTWAKTLGIVTDHPFTLEPKTCELALRTLRADILDDNHPGARFLSPSIYCLAPA
jgi:hypothetical protein